MNSKIIVPLGVFLIFFVSSTVQKNVEITLYYESLCPYCKSFVSNQLFPTWLKLDKYISIQLIPYGNARQTKIDGQWNFQCQHGPNECFVNKLHGCVLIDQHLSYEDKLGFVFCTMAKDKTTSSGESCANQLGLNWQSIVNCANSTVGSIIMAGFGDITNALTPKLQGVPTILFNEVYNETLSGQAEEDLTGVVCQLLNLSLPGICTPNNNVYSVKFMSDHLDRNHI